MVTFPTAPEPLFFGSCNWHVEGETTCQDKSTRMPYNSRLCLVEAWHFNVIGDVREFAKDHLPEAIHLSKGVIERDIEGRVPDHNAPRVPYCGGA